MKLQPQTDVRKRTSRSYPTGRRHEGGYVFAKPGGSPIHPDLISQTFERLLAKIDPPRIRLHDLRHTHATILQQQGVNPKVVSERLDHASVSFTMDAYQHVLPGMQAQAAATFGTAILGKSLIRRIRFSVNTKKLLPQSATAQQLVRECLQDPSFKPSTLALAIFQSDHSGWHITLLCYQPLSNRSQSIS